MIPRILLIISLLLFAILTLMGTDILQAAIRSFIVFLASAMLYFVGYLMVNIIGHVPEEKKDKKNSEQPKQNQTKTQEESARQSA